MGGRGARRLGASGEDVKRGRARTKERKGGFEAASVRCVQVVVHQGGGVEWQGLDVRSSARRDLH